MLVSSAVIASVGLMTQSGPAVVASMLISPMMGPLLGVAFGVMTADAELRAFAITHTHSLSLSLSLSFSSSLLSLSPVPRAVRSLMRRTLELTRDIWPDTDLLASVSRKSRPSQRVQGRRGDLAGVIRLRQRLHALCRYLHMANPRDGRTGPLPRLGVQLRHSGSLWGGRGGVS
jgi:hypothetical protein